MLGGKDEEETIRAATRAGAAAGAIGALMTWVLAKVEQIEVVAHV